MAVNQWQAGVLYVPGDLVRPASAPAVVDNAPTNANFEAGASGWTLGANWTIVSDAANAYDGSWCARFQAIGNGTIKNNNIVPVLPGQSITAQCVVNQGAADSGDAGACVQIIWYTAGMVEIGASSGPFVNSGGASNQKVSQATDVAPSNAAFAQIASSAFSDGNALYVDAFSWTYTYSAPPEGLIFKAVQADPGYSGTSEPVWPTVLGNTVVDNEVTWEAVLTSRVTWEAHRILVSGTTEPAWPTQIGGTILDGTISWEAVSRQITDEKCPHTAQVVIGAKKIFAADGDIIAFSATVNPLDWSTVDDAGYIPFGLNTYGTDGDVTALGLYRSNLVAFNQAAFQMWQIDEDPANMAHLDSVMAPCEHHATVEPYANDLGFLTHVGVRNISIAGASTNLQAEGVGEPIDPLIKAALAANPNPFAIYWPTAGQTWYVFGDEAFVLTINGTKNKSWTRYTFPEEIVAHALLNGDLYLRTSTDKVWKVDPDVLADDWDGIDGEDIIGVLDWPFLDFGSREDKQMEGVDIVSTAPTGVTFSVGYNQKNRSDRTAEHALDEDTLTGTIVPLPVTAPSFSLRLTFAAGQAWQWEQAIIHIV